MKEVTLTLAAIAALALSGCSLLPNGSGVSTQFSLGAPSVPVAAPYQTTMLSAACAPANGPVFGLAPPRLRTVEK